MSMLGNRSASMHWFIDDLYKPLMQRNLIEIIYIIENSYFKLSLPKFYIILNNVKYVLSMVKQKNWVYDVLSFIWHHCSYLCITGISCLLFAVFIYSMPGYKCSVRERMLYSSCKNPLIDTVERNLNIEIEKKVTILHQCWVSLFLTP